MTNRTTDCGSIARASELALGLKILLRARRRGNSDYSLIYSRVSEIYRILEKHTESGSHAEREALYNRLTADDVGEGDLLSTQARAEIEGRIDEIDREMECRPVARTDLDTIWRCATRLRQLEQHEASAELVAVADRIHAAGTTEQESVAQVWVNVSPYNPNKGKAYTSASAAKDAKGDETLETYGPFTVQATEEKSNG